MITLAQIKLIHVAARAAGLNREQYEMMLRNVSGVETCKDLTQAGFEDCLGVLEASGFRDPGHPADYWQRRAAGEGPLRRMQRKIYTMACDGQVKYPLASLCLRMSERRASSVEKLTAKECWNLIEALKAIIAREADAPSVRPPTSDL